MNEQDKRAQTISYVNSLLACACLTTDAAAASKYRDEAFRLMMLHNISLNEVSWPAKPPEKATGVKASRPEANPVFTITCAGGQKRTTPEKQAVAKAAAASAPEDGSVEAGKDGPTFGGWDSRMHWELEQRAQIGFARARVGFEVIEENESSIKLRNTFLSFGGPETIIATLTECNCIIFRRSGKPCKHMYFYAHSKGLFDYKAFPRLTKKEWRKLDLERKEKEAEQRRQWAEKERQEQERRWRETEPERLKAEKRRATWWYRACEWVLEFLGFKTFVFLCGALFLSGQFFLLGFLGLLKYALVKRVWLIEFAVIFVLWLIIVAGDDDGGGSGLDGLDRFAHGDPGDY